MEKKRVIVLLPKSLAYPPKFDEVPRLVDLFVTQSEEEAVSALPTADAYFQWDFASTALSKAISLDRLSWVHAASLGVDTILTDRVVNSEVQVSNSQGVYEYPIAEYVLAMILYHYKDFSTTLRFKEEKQWAWRPTQTLVEKEVALVGPGAIGSEIHKLLRAAGMKVTLVGRTARAADETNPAIYALNELSEILPKMDGVVLSLPLTDQTKGFMSAEQFSQLSRGAFFVNIGRGGLVDENALVTALQSGHLSFAGLDVFATEPLPTDSPLWKMDNVFVSPHMSADVAGWRDRISEIFVGNLKKWLAAEPLSNLVNKNKLSKKKAT